MSALKEDSTASASEWVIAFCRDYSSTTLSIAKLFLYLGLALGVVMAIAEAYQLYREARAIKQDGSPVGPRAAAPAIGEVVKELVGVLNGAKAWLALVIVGALLLWMAGSATPTFCAPS